MPIPFHLVVPIFSTLRALPAPTSKMVGIAVPGHYLMGILRIPAKRDVYVEYGGLRYVLIESAGPAWLPPGTVADHTMALLQGVDGFRIDPFF